MRAQLLPALPAGRAHAAADRHIHLPLGLSLHRAIARSILTSAMMGLSSIKRLAVKNYQSSDRSIPRFEKEGEGRLSEAAGKFPLFPLSRKREREPDFRATNNSFWMTEEKCR